MVLVPTFPIILRKAYWLSPGVKHFIFQLPENTFAYLPGQFITVHFDYLNKRLRRSYSIANPPDDSTNSTIEFAAGFVANGPGTELLFNLQPGDCLQINGPFGRLLLKDTSYKRYILIATSTGITPYRAMLPELTQRLINNPESKIVILAGVQTRQDLLYLEDFLNFAHQFPQQVTFRGQLSRQKTLDNLAYEHLGYVQTAFADLDLNPNEDLVYLCGNPGMIDSSFDLLKGQGFTVQQIIREKYFSS